jgi:hypothetical protein
LILEGLAELSASAESSGARLGFKFQTFLFIFFHIIYSTGMILLRAGLWMFDLPMSRIMDIDLRASRVMAVRSSCVPTPVARLLSGLLASLGSRSLGETVFGCLY